MLCNIVLKSFSSNILVCAKFEQTKWLELVVKSKTIFFQSFAINEKPNVKKLLSFWFFYVKHTMKHQKVLGNVYIQKLIKKQF